MENWPTLPLTRVQEDQTFRQLNFVNEVNISSLYFFYVLNVLSIIKFITLWKLQTIVLKIMFFIILSFNQNLDLSIDHQPDRFLFWQLFLLPDYHFPNCNIRNIFEIKASKSYTNKQVKSTEPNYFLHFLSSPLIPPFLDIYNDYPI